MTTLLSTVVRAAENQLWQHNETQPTKNCWFNLFREALRLSTENEKGPVTPNNSAPATAAAESPIPSASGNPWRFVEVGERIEEGDIIESLPVNESIGLSLLPEWFGYYNTRRLRPWHPISEARKDGTWYWGNGGLEISWREYPPAWITRAGFQCESPTHFQNLETEEERKLNQP